MSVPGIEVLFDWLVDGAPGAPTPMAVIERMGADFNAAGLPVERIAAFVRTLHPSIMGRRFVWEVTDPKTKVFETSWAFMNSPVRLNSPVHQVIESSEPLRLKLFEFTEFPSDDLKDMHARGLTEVTLFPMKFMAGSVHAITFATKQAGGFTDAQFEQLARVVRPLCRVAETLALMRTAVNVLNAYVGNDAGERILQGHIQRGDTELIRAVIWFSDLRGFTSLSSERSPKEIIAVLNEFFECQVPAIETEKGQVLKFIGDGLLAIFPLRQGTPGAVGDAAIRAANAAFGALGVLNTKRLERGENALGFGVALHLGEVAFGNIGGSSRLDFTAIGPAVNLASRIESMTGKLGKQVLLSAALAKEVTTPTRSVGQFELKGLTGQSELFELA